MAGKQKNKLKNSLFESYRNSTASLVHVKLVVDIPYMGIDGVMTEKKFFADFLQRFGDGIRGDTDVRPRGNRLCERRNLFRHVRHGRRFGQVLRLPLPGFEVF